MTRPRPILLVFSPVGWPGPEERSRAAPFGTLWSRPLLLLPAIEQAFREDPHSGRRTGRNGLPPLHGKPWPPRGLDDELVVCPAAVHRDDPREKTSLAQHHVDCSGVDDKHVALVEGKQLALDIDRHRARKHAVDLRPPAVIVAVLGSSLREGGHLPGGCHDHRALLALGGRKPRCSRRLLLLLVEEGGDDMLACSTRPRLECRVGAVACLVINRQGRFAICNPPFAGAGS